MRMLVSKMNESSFIILSTFAEGEDGYFWSTTSLPVVLHSAKKPKPENGVTTTYLARRSLLWREK